MTWNGWAWTTARSCTLRRRYRSETNARIGTSIFGQKNEAGSAYRVQVKVYLERSLVGRMP
jgi:hypothetical protein